MAFISVASLSLKFPSIVAIVDGFWRDWILEIFRVCYHKNIRLTQFHFFLIRLQHVLIQIGHELC